MNYNLQQLPKHLFWDINTLDKEISKTIIIERVFNRGDIKDLKYILECFGIETIKKEIIKAGFLDKKTLNYASNFLNIPKIKFQCYSKIHSNQIHWNF